MVENSAKETFPSYKKSTKYGFGLFASLDLGPGTVIQRFTPSGPSIPEKDYETIPVEERAHCLLHLNEASEWVWSITRTDARYCNHSCSPNTILEDSLDLRTFKAVKKDEELTFLYNSGSESDEWDQAWTFTCGCQSPNCQGIIDRYRPFDKKGNPF